MWSVSECLPKVQLGVSSQGPLTRRSFSSPRRNLAEADIALVEQTLPVTNEKAYAKLKAILLENGCSVIAEEPSTFLKVRQGSLWGISPRAAKKVISCRFVPVDSGTRVTLSSRLASDWKNLTIVGSVLAVIVASVCWWISLDLEGFITTHQATYWSWLATSNGYISYEFAQAFADMSRWLAIFLVVVVILEAVIFVYASKKIDLFAKYCLNLLR